MLISVQKPVRGMQIKMYMPVSSPEELEERSFILLHI